MAAFVAGVLVGSSLVGGGHGLRVRDLGLLGLWLLGGGIVLFMAFLRHRHAALARPTPGAASAGRRLDAPRAPAPLHDPPSGNPDFDRGIREIRQTDAGFDPVRFAGYTGMMFREAQAAWTVGDIGSLRGRVTPEIYGELQAEHSRLRSSGRSNHVERIEIEAEITEAWQDGGRDYVTACIGGSLVDYTVDDATDALVTGSRTMARAIEEFWTFTRPAGLNFWMLAAIHTS